MTGRRRDALRGIVEELVDGGVTDVDRVPRVALDAAGPGRPRASRRCASASCSTSGRPGSSRSGWPGRRAGRSRSSSRRARRSPTCCRPSSRRRYARVPLVVLTADRPPELRDRGAPQTIDQVGIFGAPRPLVRRAAAARRRAGDARATSGRSSAGRSRRRAAGRPARSTSTSPFREPLVPSAPLGPLAEPDARGDDRRRRARPGDRARRRGGSGLAAGWPPSSAA